MNKILEFLQSRVFKYFIAAGVATVVDVGLYYLCFNFAFDKQPVNLIGSFVLKATTASLIISYSCGLVTNFSISKFLVFTDSDMKTSSAFFRFVMVALFVLVLNYFFMNFLIHQLQWYPTISRAVSALSIGVLSFLFHKFFTFKVSSLKKS
jgi:putative flippase GtrA